MVRDKTNIGMPDQPQKTANLRAQIVMYLCVGHLDNRIMQKNNNHHEKVNHIGVASHQGIKADVQWELRKSAS